MKKSKIRLLFSITIIFLSIYNIFSFIRFNHNYTLNNNKKISKGVIYKTVLLDDYKIIYIKGKENIKGYISSTSKVQTGDIIKFDYDLKDIKFNKSFNCFNYYSYLKGLNIKKVVSIKKAKKIGYKKSYLLNNLFQKLIEKRKTKSYIYTFLNADKTYIDHDIRTWYSDNGIMHLLCISGFHISLLILFIKIILQVFIKNNSILMMIVFLICCLYLKLCLFSIPLYRAILFYFMNYFNKKYNLNLRKNTIFLLVLNVVLLNNTNCLYQSSLYYTFIIYFFLSNSIKSFESESLTKLFKTSLFMFLVSLPLNAYYNFNVNLLSVFINILFSGVICYMFYPLSFLSVFFAFFDKLYFKLICCFEYINMVISNVKLFRIIIPKIPQFSLIIMYIILFLFLKYKKKGLVIVFILIIFIFKFQIYFDRNSYVYFNDVGQGDMSLIISAKHRSITLIDSGGNNTNFFLKDNNIKFLHSLGISQIDNFIITHGDYDHMGEAINLVNNFKVEKVIFNCGEFNDLEKELIKVLDKKKIKYSSCIKELNIDKDKLYFLQTKEYDNENDNSNVIYTELNGYKFMFMGDASITTEKEIIDKYNLPNIDVLKVGHHGSKTSSGKEFIDEINPKYSVISVGKKNRYGHPNKEVLDNLENSKIYRTDQDGSIMFKIKNNKLKIKTCSP